MPSLRQSQCLNPLVEGRFGTLLRERLHHAAQICFLAGGNNDAGCGTAFHAGAQKGNPKRRGPPATAKVRADLTDWPRRAARALALVPPLLSGACRGCVPPARQTAAFAAASQAGCNTSSRPVSSARQNRGPAAVVFLFTPHRSFPWWAGDCAS